MRKLLYILSAQALFICQYVSAQQLDSVKRIALDEKLAEYVLSMEREGARVQQEECDFLIESCTDSLVRQYVANSLYDYYLTSNVMGAESVAIHILDEWFFNGKVKMPDEIDLINARVYADFNRQSLIGLKAPALSMKDIHGAQVDLYATPPGRYSILYFYDTDCSKCKFETVRLRNFLMTEEFPVDVYAVYAGDNAEAWEKYVSDRFAMAADLNVVHIWDPELDSDFQRKYAVLQTPRMLLVDPEGVIVGRGLDTEALSQLLHSIFDEKKLNYGSPDSEQFLDRMLGPSPAGEDIVDFIEKVGSLGLERKDTLIYRQFVGDLLYYLAPRSEESYREGLSHLIDKHILAQDKVWKTEDDSLKVVGFAQIMEELLSKSEVGSLVADIKVKGELSTSRRTKTVTRNLRRLRGKENIIIFHTEGCNICAAEMKAASSIIKKKPQVKVFSINMDEAVALSPSLAARLFDAFDLTVLPYIIITDRKGMIVRRYVSLQ